MAAPASGREGKKKGGEAERSEKNAKTYAKHAKEQKAIRSCVQG